MSEGRWKPSLKAPPKRIYNSASVPQEECVFCKIVSGALPSYNVYEDDGHVAFLDINPFALGHTLVCPKRHGETLWDMDDHEIAEVFKVSNLEELIKKVLKLVFILALLVPLILLPLYFFFFT